MQRPKPLRFLWPCIPPLLPAYNKYMGGVDHLSQVRKTYGFIENRSDTGYVLFSVFYYAIKCRHWADVQFITPPLPALFVKFISARFPVLQTITRTELCVVSCWFMRVGTIASHLVVVTFLCICVCMYADLNENF